MSIYKRMLLHIWLWFHVQTTTDVFIKLCLQCWKYRKPNQTTNDNTKQIDSSVYSDSSCQKEIFKYWSPSFQEKNIQTNKIELCGRGKLVQGNILNCNPQKIACIFISLVGKRYTISNPTNHICMDEFIYEHNYQHATNSSKCIDNRPCA